MITSSCLCRKNSSFIPYIIYKDETVFEDYEGTVIGKCSTCGLLKTIPPLHSKKFNPTITKFKEYESLREEFELLFQPIVKAVKKHFPQNGSILDVGCSSGILLSLLEKEGCGVTGLEPNKDAFKIAHQKLGDNIIHGTINDIPEGETYDCIIYNHVLEHIENISQEFLAIKKRLNKNGLLIIGVPNRDNAIFKIRGKYWEYLLPNEHVWHFSTHYLSDFLDREGFKVLTTQFFNDKRRDYLMIKRIYFSFLSLLNIIFRTGEAVLIISQMK